MLTAVVLVVGGLTLVAGTPANAGPSASPVVRDCGLGAAQTRPGSMILACADGNLVADHLRWRSWNATRAVATATVTWQADTARRDHTSAQITLSDPVPEADGETLFTTLTMHVTGAAPGGFKRNLSFDEAPPMATPGAAKAVQSVQPAAASGSLNTAAIGGYWELAGGPSSVAGTAEAITGAESAFEPGSIEPAQPYATTGWGLWQITPGNSVLAYGQDYQLLDPWNNAEAAVAKFDGAGGFSPWTTFDDGAYEAFLGDTATPDTNLSDPGQYTPTNGAPAGTHNASGPGSTFGPTIPGGSSAPPPAPGFAFKAVFQANNDFLAGLSSGGSSFTTTLGMMAGTSPSVTTLSDGTFEAAFEANTDNLALSHLGGGTLSTHEGMLQGTSPAIAALPGGGWIAAFQANTNHLVLFDSGQHVTDTDLGMDPGTNPAIAVQSDGSYRVVFQANNDLLAGYNSSGSNFTSTAGMKAGTSPAITTLPGGQYEVGIQANTGKLATLHLGTGITVNTTDLGMDPASGPAVAAQSNGTFRVVFEANNDLLAGYNSSGSNFTATTGMKAGTSPSITAEPGGEYEVAVEANTDKLATLHFGTGYTVDTTDLGMADATAPAITF